MKNVLITGATGTIGTALARKLIIKGYSVSILSRSDSKIPLVKTYIWNVTDRIIDVNAIINADYIIHLAGSNIGNQNWSEAVKKEIIDSRKDSTAFLYDTIKKYNPNLKAFISSSAVGFYGLKKTDKVFEETDEPGKDFLAHVCVQWEANVAKIKDLGIRTVIVRTGVVLSKKGGILEQMMTPTKLGVGAVLGSGKQYIPWIHLNDICSVYINAIENEEFKGIYNAVGLEHTNNKEFTKVLAKIMKKPLFLPNVPAFAMKLALGERSIIALKGNKVSAQKLLDTGFKFEFETLKSALKDLVS